MVKNFEWLVFFDMNILEIYCEKINELVLKFFNFIFIYVDGMENFYLFIKKEIVFRLIVFFFIMMRFDNDDSFY